MKEEEEAGGQINDFDYYLVDSIPYKKQQSRYFLIFINCTTPLSSLKLQELHPQLHQLDYSFHFFVSPLEDFIEIDKTRMPRLAVTQWVHKKVVDPLVQILRRGAEPKQLAWSSALGLTLGVFPICGVTVFLCGVAIALLGSACHAPTVMLFNFVATPIELSLIVPFLRLGEMITGGPPFPLTSDALKKVLTGQASYEVLLSILRALLGWFIAAPFIFAALYIIFLPCFKFLVKKIKAASD